MYANIWQWLQFLPVLSPNYVIIIGKGKNGEKEEEPDTAFITLQTDIFSPNGGGSVFVLCCSKTLCFFPHSRRIRKKNVQKKMIKNVSKNSSRSPIAVCPIFLIAQLVHANNNGWSGKDNETPCSGIHQVLVSRT